MRYSSLSERPPPRSVVSSSILGSISFSEVERLSLRALLEERPPLVLALRPNEKG